MILHSRFYKNFLTGTLAASGQLSFTGPNPMTDTPAKMQKGQYVQKTYTLYNRPFADYDGTLDYDGDIVMKRFRVTSNVPGAFYATNFTTLGFGWCWDDQDTFGSPYNQNYYHWTENILKIGEWCDVNVTLPRNDAALKDFGHASYRHPYIGAWIPTSKFWYAGVPAEYIGQTGIITLELEVAMTKDPSSWYGSRE